ncbi:hypothetical protein D3C77_331850 [compost metagenome]
MSPNDPDKQLRAALQEHTNHWTAPPHLQKQILEKISPTKGGTRMKKWLVTTIVTALLLVPVGAYAGYQYLADSIYGSKEAVMELGGTTEQYERLEKKLLNAKQQLNEEEFTKFMSILKELGQFYLKYADSSGEIHPEAWNTQDQTSYEALVKKLTPLFERLEQLDQQGSASPMDDKAFWEEALKLAKQKFTETEFNDFNAIYTKMWSYKSTVVDKDNQIHWDRLTEQEQAELNDLRPKLMQYLERLGYKVK